MVLLLPQFSLGAAGEEPPQSTLKEPQLLCFLGGGKSVSFHGWLTVSTENTATAFDANCYLRKHVSPDWTRLNAKLVIRREKGRLLLLLRCYPLARRTESCGAHAAFPSHR